MRPEDEREKIWTALGTTSDRVTGLEAVVNARTEMMRDSIYEAVREAMPTALISDDEHRWVKMSIEREHQRSMFRKKIIESSIAWAVPVCLGLIGLMGWTVIKEYLISHGMWRP